jgi:hypothetical protein
VNASGEQTVMTHRSLTRRAALWAAVAGAGTILLGNRAAGQASNPEVVRGDCSQVPGLQLMLDWYAGQPVISHQELVPPATWRIFTAPGTPVFLYPGDWTPYPRWAETLSPAGSPVWLTSPTPTSYVAGARIVSPDGRSLYEYVSGTFTGTALSLDQSAMAAEQGVLGEGEMTTPICVIEDSRLFNPYWTRGGRVGDSILLTGGSIYSDGNPSFPMTVITYQAMMGPEAIFEDLVRTVFIPIMYQFRMAGSSIVPTPIPTPTPTF